MMYLLDPEKHAQIVEALRAMQSEAAARNCGLRICDEALAMLKAMQPVKPCGYTSPDWVSLKGNGTIVKKPVQTWTCPVYTPTKD
jgi:hypothetical protein